MLHILERFNKKIKVSIPPPPPPPPPPHPPKKIRLNAGKCVKTVAWEGGSGVPDENR